MVICQVWKANCLRATQARAVLAWSDDARWKGGLISMEERVRLVNSSLSLRPKLGTRTAGGKLSVKARPGTVPSQRSAA